MEVWQVVTASVAYLSTLFLVILWWFAWRWKRYAMDLIVRLNNRIEEKETPGRLAECETYVKAFSARIDTYAVENETFRNAVHKSMQRFDNIMRRNERALIGKADKVIDGDEERAYPDEIRLGEHEPPQRPTGRLTRPELRELARKAGKYP